MDRFYTIEEIAHLLRMSAGTARNRLSRGDDLWPLEWATCCGVTAFASYMRGCHHR
jgi:hypothetical protein